MIQQGDEIDSMQIYACGNEYHLAAEPLIDLKASVQATGGEQVRRVGRFIQLALIGAGRCAQPQALPTDTAVYFSSGRGDLETTVDVMTALFRDGHAPKPLSFVNTVSNAACFYVARSLKLQSRSNFVCNRFAAFESVLQLAMLDLENGGIDSALVGSVDLAMTPLQEHRRRLQLPDQTPIAEGSHWLWLGPSREDRPRLGELLAARHFASRETLFEWLSQERGSLQGCALTAGQFLDDEDFAEVQHMFEGAPVFEYRGGRGYYDSQSGAAVAAFLNDSIETQRLLHINGDPAGRFSIMLATR